MLPILHVSDFHFHRPWFEWTKRVAKKFSAVAYTGDFLDSAYPSTPAVEQVAWVTKWCRDFPVPLWVVSGNHDHDRDDLPPHLQRWVSTSLAFDHVTTDGMRTALGPWTVECAAWGEVPRAEIPQCLALVHCPPEGAETAMEETVGIDYGDFELANILRHGFRPPELVLSGHVHLRRRFYDSTGFAMSLNPGRAEGGAHPNHIIINLTVRTAELISNTEDRKTISF